MNSECNVGVRINMPAWTVNIYKAWLFEHAICQQQCRFTNPLTTIYSSYFANMDLGTTITGCYLFFLCTMVKLNNKVIRELILFYRC